MPLCIQCIFSPPSLLMTSLPTLISSTLMILHAFGCFYYDPRASAWCNAFTFRRILLVVCFAISWPISGDKWQNDWFTHHPVSTEHSSASCCLLEKMTHQKSFTRLTGRGLLWKCAHAIIYTELVLLVFQCILKGQQTANLNIFFQAAFIFFFFFLQLLYIQLRNGDHSPVNITMENWCRLKKIHMRVWPGT